MSQALDEAVSIASEVTTEVTTVDTCEPGDAGASSGSGASTGEEGGFVPAGSLLAGDAARRRFTPHERCTLEKYETVFFRLHLDIDLLVLRCPLVGEAAAALLRDLAGGLAQG